MNQFLTGRRFFRYKYMDRAGKLVLWGLFVLLSGPAVTSLAVAGDEELQRYEATQRQLGTDVQVILYAESREQAEVALRAAFARIEQLDRVLSDYDENSEASQLGRMAPMRQPEAVSKDLWQALRVSLFVSQKSRGAFDVTVGPLSRLWRRAHRQGELPSAERMVEARAAVGYRFVRLYPRSQSVQLSRPGMRLDFGGIGKGMAADAALQEIAARGLRVALVDCGGDMAIGDAPPGSMGWRIGVASLDPDSAERLILLSNVGVATSGDAHQYVEIDGTRYSHIVDPRTGIGLTTRSSVTVIAADGMLADAVASAVSVLGPRRGTRLVRHWRGVETQVLSLKDGILFRHATPGFPERIAAEP
jgi:thiamine biosynthesis lipoprotein